VVFDSKKGGERVLRRFEVCAVWVFWHTRVVYVDQVLWKGEGWIPGLGSTCYCSIAGRGWQMLFAGDLGGFFGGVRRVEVLFGGWDLSEAGANMAAACGDCLQGKSTPCGVVYHTKGTWQ